MISSSNSSPRYILSLALVIYCILSKAQARRLKKAKKNEFPKRREWPKTSSSLYSSADDEDWEPSSKDLESSDSSKIILSDDSEATVPHFMKWKPLMATRGRRQR